MFRLIEKVHSFLVSQLFYPILLSSGLAVAIYSGRVLASGVWVVYANLVWNLFLAWIPYLFSMLAAAIHLLFPRQWWLLIIPAGIWLIFFPNAPYMVTDFFHLLPRPRIPLWYDILLLITFSFTGIFLAIASLKTMQELVKHYLGSVIGWVFAAFTLGMCGLGIYLGRFERWNSWDLVVHPRSILSDVAVSLVDPLANLRFFVFTVLFTAFLFVCYFMFVSMRPLEKAGKQGE